MIDDERAKRELKQYRSILDMLKGNTPVEGIRKLEHEWLTPIMERMNTSSDKSIP